MVRGPFQEVQVLLNRVAGIPLEMDAHLSGTPCQSECQRFVGQGLSASSFQQGFLNSDLWAN